MVITILLLLILFLAGLVNFYMYVPSKKLQSFLFRNSVSSTADKATPQKQSNNDKNKRKKDELKSVFATFDKNGDGFITKQELRESLKNIRIFMTEKEIEEMVVNVDSNGDGLIDFEEFCLLCVDQEIRASIGEDGQAVEGEGEIDLKDAFDVFDRDKDGLISVEELGLVLSSLGLKEGNRVEDCKEMIRKVDMDGDGMVNFDEFKKMMMRSATGNNKIIPVF